MLQSLCPFSSSSTNDENSDESALAVYVNVYDMRPENNWGYHLGIGVWHTGVQLFNSMEVTFGGHPGDFTGVFSVPPKSIPLPLRHSIRVGTLTKSPVEIKAILEQISADYPGNSYNILHRNCNHFSDDLCRRLLGKGIPGYINRLAGIASLMKCWLPPTIRDPTAQLTQPQLSDDDGDGPPHCCNCHVHHHQDDPPVFTSSSSSPSSSSSSSTSPLNPQLF